VRGGSGTPQSGGIQAKRRCRNESKILTFSFIIIELTSSGLPKVNIIIRRRGDKEPAGFRGAIKFGSTDKR
jgi:hypothetical protein